MLVRMAVQDVISIYTLPWQALRLPLPLPQLSEHVGIGSYLSALLPTHHHSSKLRRQPSAYPFHGFIFTAPDGHRDYANLKHIIMLSMALLALSLLGFTNCEILNTVRMPAYRKSLGANSSVLGHPVTYNEDSSPGMWFTKLGLGSPPQSVEVLLDTGSSDPWAPSSEFSDCLRSKCPGGSCEFLSDSDVLCYANTAGTVD